MCFGLVRGGLLAAYTMVLGRVRLRPARLERWLQGEQTAYDSPPLAAGVRGEGPARAAARTRSRRRVVGSSPMIEEMLPGLAQWSASHEGIGATVYSRLVIEPGTLIDPMTPADGVEQLARHGEPRRLVLSNRHHYASRTGADPRRRQGDVDGVRGDRMTCRRCRRCR
ncbi:MAG: hypothetical protein ACYCUM_13440 [Solirubrobacteraceae bacterium]